MATDYASPLSIAMSPAAQPFNVVEAGIPDLQQALSEGRLTSRQLVVAYLTRIALYEDQLKAIMIVNPHVLEEAEARDRERAEGTVRGRCTAFPGFNPYDPRRDPREDTNDGRPALPTGGSSSGIGTAASFWAALLPVCSQECTAVLPDSRYGSVRSGCLTSL